MTVYDRNFLHQATLALTSSDYRACRLSDDTKEFEAANNAKRSNEQVKPVFHGPRKPSVKVRRPCLIRSAEFIKYVS